MNESPIEIYKHLKMVHELNRRLRVISPVIHKDLERAYVLEIMLKKRPGILDVRTVPAIGSVAIRFDPEQLAKTDLGYGQK